MAESRSWNYSSGFSDHKAIILPLDFDRGYVSYPFKFKLTWLLEEDFNSLVVEQCGILSLEVPPRLHLMQSLIYKLNKLRTLVVSWEKEMKLKDDNSLCKVGHVI